MAVLNEISQLTRELISWITRENPTTAEEYDQGYSSWLESSKLIMEGRVQTTLDHIANIESMSVEGKISEAQDLYLEVTRYLFVGLTSEMQKSLWDECRPRHPKKTRSSNGAIPTRTEKNGCTIDNGRVPRPTQERDDEENPNVERGQSQIYGFNYRSRNDPRSPGNYAGHECLITRHGWKSIILPDGHETFLQDAGIFEKYQSHLPADSKKVPFRSEDRKITVEWKRLQDGTLVFVRIV